MALFVLVKAYYVFNYVFSFDCSCLFADRLSLFSQFFLRYYWLFAIGY